MWGSHFTERTLLKTDFDKVLPSLSRFLWPSFPIAKTTEDSRQIARAERRLTTQRAFIHKLVQGCHRQLQMRVPGDLIHPAPSDPHSSVATQTWRWVHGPSYEVRWLETQRENQLSHRCTMKAIKWSNCSGHFPSSPRNVVRSQKFLGPRVHPHLLLFNAQGLMFVITLFWGASQSK